MDLSELNAAYEQAMRGSHSPDLVAIKCEVCDRGFWLTKNGPNEVCEHLRMRLGIGATTVEQRVAHWIRTRIGETATAPKERAMRLFEEAAELAQSMGLTQEMLVRQVDHVFGRKLGDPFQEAGGVAVCLAGWCAANDTTIEAVLMAELERIECQPIEEIRGSLARKSDAGLLYESAEEE